MDALSDVLRVAPLTGGVFLQAEFFEPWCVASRREAETGSATGEAAQRVASVAARS
jgi:hypothetical protein